MAEDVKKDAIRDQNTFEKTANYLFTDKCTSCSKYYESDSKHHCTSLSPLASSNKSVKENFKEYNNCPDYEESSSANAERFHHTYILFIITMGVVIFGLLTRPLVMLQKYWFFGALSVGLMIMSFIRYGVVGDIALADVITKKQKTLNKIFNGIIAISIFIAYFIYKNGFGNLSFSTFFTWIIFLILLFFISNKVLPIAFEFYINVYRDSSIIKSIILILVATIGLSIIFGLINYVLGLVVMADSYNKEYSTGSKIIEKKK